MGELLRVWREVWCRVQGRCGSAGFLRALHGWLTIGWLLMAVPALLWWQQSVPFLVFVSVYANFAGHFSSWQASRIEHRMDDDAGR